MTSRIQRTGAVVRLPANFWTAGLLRRLQAAGFPAPRPLDTEDDRELLTWIDGESSWFLHPLPRHRRRLPSLAFPDQEHDRVHRGGPVCGERLVFQ
jgi:hypothetical protein